MFACISPSLKYATLQSIACTFVCFTDARLDDSKEKEAYALALKEGKAKPSSVRIVVVNSCCRDRKCWQNLPN